MTQASHKGQLALTGHSSAPVRAYQFVRRWPILPVAILVVLVIGAVFAPFVAPHNPGEADLRARNTPPVWSEGGSARYLLGADHQGRDVLSRVIFGARVSLAVAGAALGIGGLAGTVLGMTSGYIGGWTDEIIMRLADVLLAIPVILIALVVVIAVGQNFGVLVGILAVTSWSGFARQARAEVLQMKTLDYVSMAKISGASVPRILVRHIFPGLISTISVFASFQVGNLIVTEAILSFLGAGIPPPTSSWGNMISDGRIYIGSAWWITFFPGVALFLAVLAFNFLGDWSRDRLDPKLRQI